MHKKQYTNQKKGFIKHVPKREETSLWSQEREKRRKQSYGWKDTSNVRFVVLTLKEKTMSIIYFN